VSTYPIRTTPNQVRWAGLIVQDISERKRSEETLRKTEKLAATGRLAASIAHEVNNPLEAITNLLYLLRNFCDLDEPAMRYVTMAEREGKRIADIAQQTLRFYRQSTLPQRATMAELLDSVVDIYQSRLHTLNIDVTRQYDPMMDLYCYAGEVRQVISNLVGNAIDATRHGRQARGPGAALALLEVPRCFRCAFYRGRLRRRHERGGAGAGLRGVLHHQGGFRHRPGPLGEPRNHPQASWPCSCAQQGGGRGRTIGNGFQIFLPDNEKLITLPRTSTA